MMDSNKTLKSKIKVFLIPLSSKANIDSESNYKFLKKAKDIETIEVPFFFHCLNEESIDLECNWCFLVDTNNEKVLNSLNPKKTLESI